MSEEYECAVCHKKLSWSSAYRCSFCSKIICRKCSEENPRKCCGHKLTNWDNEERDEFPINGGD